MPSSFLVRNTLLAYMLGVGPLQAHEFWFTPIASPQAKGSTVALPLEVGELFTGDAAGFSIPTTQALRHYSAQSQAQDLRPFLPPHTPRAEVALALDTAGTHLFAYDSTPRRITLDAHRFHAYLHDEGLDMVKTQRDEAGTTNQPGRERYRRHVKALVAVDPEPSTNQTPDPTYATQTGQRLEILPLQDPLTQAPGDVLPLKIVFDKQPLAGALVKAWHKHKGQLLMIRATTSAQGLVAFDLPYAGDWMLSVVHMIPAVASGDEEEGADWDSFWGNLSFHVAQPPSTAFSAQ
ncbi:MAG: DUF4198 domain-containing protein [Pseudomonadota bacterium]